MTPRLVLLALSVFLAAVAHGQSIVAAGEARELSIHRDRELAALTLTFDSGAPTANVPVQLTGLLSGQIKSDGYIEAKVKIGVDVQVPDVGSVIVGNYAKFDGQLTITADPCNYFFWTIGVEGELEFKLGREDVTCELGNINGCVQYVSDLLDDASEFKFPASFVDGGKTTCDTTASLGGALCNCDPDAWVSTSVTECCAVTTDCTSVSNLSKKSCKCPHTHKATVSGVEHTIDVSDVVENFEIKLSDVLAATGKGKAIAKLMKLTGTDVKWKITPGTLKAQYKAIQTGITMTVDVMNLANSNNAAVRTAKPLLATAMGDRPDGGNWFPLYSKSMDFIKLVKESVPDLAVPAWVTEDGANHVIRFGEISNDCSPTTKTFEITVPGGDSGLATTADKDDVAKALAVMLKASIPPAFKLLLPTCEDSTWGDLSGFPVTIMCPFDGITLTADGDNVKIAGTVMPMAGLNAGGMTSYMKAQTLPSITVDGSAITASAVTGVDCTASEKKSGYEYACDASAAPPEPEQAIPVPDGAAAKQLSAAAATVCSVATIGIALRG